MKLKGTLEVRAKVDTRRGMSEGIVTAGTVGYVTGASPKGWAVYWPSIPLAYIGDWRTSVHPKEDLEPTGNRHP